MYTEQDLSSILKQQNKRWLVVGSICLLLAGVVVFSLVKRIEALTTCTTIVLGAVLIFGYDMFIRPLHRYAIFLNNALHGRTREADCVYQSVDADPSQVDGVYYFGMTVQQTDDDGKPFDRLFYWDAEKPFPQLQQGDKLHIVYHDRMVADLTRI
ncbi:MAG: hypothetical protein E7316_10150 [Clostridiales bacterium]|nr:hypothetical protein [Clostridiales bacterium]